MRIGANDVMSQVAHCDALGAIEVREARGTTTLHRRFADCKEYSLGPA